MEPMAAFHAAMVPLITEGVSMGILIVVTLVWRRDCWLDEEV